MVVSENMKGKHVKGRIYHVSLSRKERYALQQNETANDRLVFLASSRTILIAV